jgi:hypothetical protein
MPRFQFIVDVPSAETRQAKIEDDDGRNGLLDLAQGIGAVFDRRYRIARCSQRRPIHFPQRLIVLDDENFPPDRPDHSSILKESFHP